MEGEGDGGRGDEAAVAKVYGEIASAYEVLYPSLHRYGDRVERFLAGVVKPDVRVLDVGCGPALHTRGLDASVDVVGLDVAPEMLELASARGRRARGACTATWTRCRRTWASSTWRWPSAAWTSVTTCRACWATWAAR
ncbi:class I SAM-dependent methyltransferase [Corallococcus sp. 4LFB]|uniref:class I SAM-dependent methyltransferase n=1 Tax=Corallococcus sp. 4LFB TaxID=3383249 RepID=UPI00397618F9